MSIFDALAIEAGKKAWLHSRDMTDDTSFDSIMAFIKAAEASMRERERLRDGQGYHDADGGEAWDATTGGFREPGGFPVIIIQAAPPPSTKDERT